MKRHYFCIILLVLALCGCQPTPTESMIQGKGNLQKKIEETSEQNTYEDVEDKIKLTKEFSDENRLEVDAEIIGKDVKTLPVYNVISKKYEDGQNIKNIITKAFPHHDIREYVKLTQEHLMEMLMQYQLWLDRYNNNLNMYTGEPLKEGEKQPGMPLAEKYQVEIKPGEEHLIVDPSVIDNLNALIEETKEKIAAAPSEKGLKEADCIFKETAHGASEELAVQLIKEGESLVFVAVNWNAYPGSSLLIWNKKLEQSEERGSFSPKYYRCKDLEWNSEFAETKEITDALVKNLGANYMSLDRVRIDEEHNAFQFYYTRDIVGLNEGFIGNYYSPTAIDSESGEYIDLWGSEYFTVETLNGQIVSANWENPSVIEEVVSNTKAMLWDEIWKIAEKQLEYIVSPKTDNANIPLFEQHNDIVIDCIELGYTKTLIKNTFDQYQLIPTWNFYGYDRSNPDKEICFLTINVVDGSIIDHVTMY